MIYQEAATIDNIDRKKRSCPFQVTAGSVISEQQDARSQSHSATAVGFSPVEQYPGLTSSDSESASAGTCKSLEPDAKQLQCQGSGPERATHTPEEKCKHPSLAAGDQAGICRNDCFSSNIVNLRNLAISQLITEYGLSTNQIVKLSLGDLDLKRRRIVVENEKESRLGVISIGDNMARVLAAYLRYRSPTKENKLFLIESGSERGGSLNVKNFVMQTGFRLRKRSHFISCNLAG